MWHCTGIRNGWVAKWLVLCRRSKVRVTPRAKGWVRSLTVHPAANGDQRNHINIKGLLSSFTSFFQLPWCFQLYLLFLSCPCIRNFYISDMTSTLSNTPARQHYTLSHRIVHTSRHGQPQTLSFWIRRVIAWIKTFRYLQLAR